MYAGEVGAGPPARRAHHSFGRVPPGGPAAVIRRRGAAGRDLAVGGWHLAPAAGCAHPRGRRSVDRVDRRGPVGPRAPGARRAAGRRACAHARRRPPAVCGRRRRSSAAAAGRCSDGPLRSLIARGALFALGPGGQALAARTLGALAAARPCAPGVRAGRGASARGGRHAHPRQPRPAAGSPPWIGPPGVASCRRCSRPPCCAWPQPRAGPSTSCGRTPSSRPLKGPTYAPGPWRSRSRRSPQPGSPRSCCTPEGLPGRSAATARRRGASPLRRWSWRADTRP